MNCPNEWNIERELSSLPAPSKTEEPKKKDKKRRMGPGGAVVWI